MIYLKEVYIKNFRKIVEQRINLNDIDVFVGLNDIGKSTILKALNLFFNEETEAGQKFNFKEDFSRNHRTKKNKAKEIVVELKFIVPKGYTETNDILWKRTWRNEGLHSDLITYSDGEEIPPKRKIKAWLRKINYMYVPAIKGQDYFIELLGKLHDTLAVAIEEDLVEASGNFSKTIKESTEGITKEIENKVKLQSFLDLPSDLRNIFRSLEFKTGNENILLTHRGDGIKTRHIPVILKFISEQENLKKIKGTPAISTIWGYEEPENSLEMLKAFELARDLLDYSRDIQMLITTHSPAFYSIENLKRIYPDVILPSSIGIRFVEDDISDGIKLTKKEDKSINIDEKTGILALLEPKIKETIEENKKMSLELSKINVNTIIVEGKADKIIFDKAIEIFSPALKGLITEKKLNIDVSSSGASGVADLVIAVAHGKKYKCFGILDADFEGEQKKKYIESLDRCTSARGNYIQFKTLPQNSFLGEIRQELTSFDFEIEDLLGEDVWKMAEDKGYLQKRAMRISPIIPTDQTAENFFKSKFSDPNKVRLCIFQIEDAKKGELAEWAIKNNPEKNLENFKPLIKIMEDFFK